MASFRAPGCFSVIPTLATEFPALSGATVPFHFQPPSATGRAPFPGNGVWLGPFESRWDAIDRVGVAVARYLIKRFASDRPLPEYPK